MNFTSLADFVPIFVIAATVFIMRARFRTRVDVGWPLIYYFLLVVYVRANEGKFNNYMVFGGVLAALLLRYEFMGGFVLKFVRFTEFVVHCYVIYICLNIITSP